MKHINLIRGLGIICICSAAASFLYEGWNAFNGLEKYLIFFGFVVALFGFSEAFRKSSESLSKIFSGLFLTLSPAITAQLGSFIVDGDSRIDLPSLFSPSPLPDGSPLKFICIVSMIFLGSMMFRSIVRLKSTSTLPDFICLLASQLIILVPLRTSEFHALGLLSLFVSFGIIARYIKFSAIDTLANTCIRIAPIVFFLGRAALYSSSPSLELVIWLISSLVFFNYIPDLFKEDSLKIFSYVLGYICVVVMGHVVSDFNLWNDYKWTVITVELLLMSYVICFKQSLKIGFFFMIMLACFSFLELLVTDRELTILALSVNIVLPLAILILSYSFKYAFGFASSGVLLLAALVHVSYRVIKLPVVNMWMIFGIVGISLLLLSFLIEKPHQKLLEFWNKSKRFFSEEL